MINRFDKLAKQWDSKPMRVENALLFIQKIKENIKKNINDLTIIDYGCGSGLVSFGFADDAKEIYGYDNSRGMIEVYNQKAKKLGFSNIYGVIHNIEKEDIEKDMYDIAVSNMTMHHIDSMENFIIKLVNGIKKGGYLFIADLCKEDGSFHSDNKDVKHFGFELNDVKKAFEKAGLKNINISILNSIKKTTGDYDIFFAMGIK